MIALRGIGIAATLFFVFSAFTPFWNFVGRRLRLEPQLTKSDAIVVLGAGVLMDGTLSHESLRRTVHGLRLYKRGLAPLLVVSGPTPRTDARRGGLPEAEVRKAIALEMGIPAGDVIAISQVHTTRDESEEIAARLAERRSTTILLVTESMHMRRAMELFERAGLRVFPAPSDDFPRVAESPESRIGLMWRALIQLAGVVYYRAAGYT